MKLKSINEWKMKLKSINEWKMKLKLIENNQLIKNTTN